MIVKNISNPELLHALLLPLTIDRMVTFLKVLLNLPKNLLCNCISGEIEMGMGVGFPILNIL